MLWNKDDEILKLQERNWELLQENYALKKKAGEERRLFAAMAMQGILANSHFSKLRPSGMSKEAIDKLVAIGCVATADALIAELDKAGV